MKTFSKNCIPYTLHFIHTAFHTHCIPYTLHSIHTAFHTHCIPYTLHSIHTSFLQCSSSIPGILPSKASLWGLAKILFRGQRRVLNHKGRNVKVTICVHLITRFRSGLLFLCKASLHLSDPESLVLGFTIKMVVPHKHL